MNKLLFLFILLLCVSNVIAQEVFTVTIDSTTTCYLLIPFEQFIFYAGKGQADYQLSTNLIDKDKKTVFQKIFEIRINQDMVVDKASMLLQFEVKLKPGDYKLITMLKNTMLGDKKEKQIGLTIPGWNKKSTGNIFIADNGLIKYVPSSFAQMDSRLKSCYLIYNIPPDCDSLLIDYVTTTTKGSEKFVANAKHQYDLMPVLQKGNLIKLELRCYSANAIEQPGWTPFVNSNKYSELFSLEDQLQQIRYIANQNEWKTLKKATSSNMSEAIEWFWEKHDTNPDVKQNDTREMFYDRVMKAEELFTIHKKLRGWRSDRGRVYIMHGPPDDIAEDFFSIGMYPMIKWYYYRENKVFTFVDKTGYGNYKIMDEYYEN